MNAYALHRLPVYKFSAEEVVFLTTFFAQSIASMKFIICFFLGGGCPRY